MSPLSVNDGKNLRKGSLPLHGFFRTQVWEVEGEEGLSTNEVTLSLSSNDETKAIWNHEFELRYNVKLSTKGLIFLVPHEYCSISVQLHLLPLHILLLSQFFRNPNKVGRNKLYRQGRCNED